MVSVFFQEHDKFFSQPRVEELLIDASDAGFSFVVRDGHFHVEDKGFLERSNSKFFHELVMGKHGLI